MIRNKISIIRLLVQIAYVGIFFAGILSHNWVILFVTVSTIFLGQIFCGWMCFLGLYQDVLRYFGSFLRKEPIEIPRKIHNILKFARFILLLCAITIGGIFLVSGEIQSSLARIFKGHAVSNIVFYSLIILGVVSLFTKRFFCRYFCTFGAKLGLFALLRPITINRDKATCISCKLCSKECLMHIQVDKINSLVNPNCINCLKCIECCPKNSLKIGLRNYLKP